MATTTDTPRELPRLALSKTEAAAVLGVSVDFFDEHLAHEMRCINRGRRRLYAVSELQAWLQRALDGTEGRKW